MRIMHMHMHTVGHVMGNLQSFIFSIQIDRDYLMHAINTVKEPQRFGHFAILKVGSTGQPC